MNSAPDIASHGIDQARRIPLTLSRSLAQSARAQIIRLEVIVRRRSTLMALAPVRLRAATAP